MTECNKDGIEFGKQGRRRAQVDFDGGRLASDGGLVLVREMDQRMGFSQALAEASADPCDPAKVDHDQAAMLSSAGSRAGGGLRGPQRSSNASHGPGGATGRGRQAEDRRPRQGPGKTHRSSPAQQLSAPIAVPSQTISKLTEPLTPTILDTSCPPAIRPPAHP